MYISLEAETGVIVIVTLFIAIAIDRVPIVRAIAYPLLLFITFIHEFCHGLAAIATGGEFRRFVIRPDKSGTAWYVGGWDLLVIPAGYVGTAIFSAMLILLTGIEDSAPLVLGGLGTFMILLVLAFGLTSLTTVIGGVGMGGSLILIGIYLGAGGALFIISLIAFVSCLDTLSSLRSLRIIDRYGIPVQNDARDMASSFGCTATIWAWVWSMTSTSIVGWAMWFAWL